MPATNVNLNLVLQTGTSDIHGWSLCPSACVGSGFTLSYDISVAPVQLPRFAIISSKDQINTGCVPNGIVITDTQTGAGVAIVTTGSLPGRLPVLNIHFADVFTPPRRYVSPWAEFVELRAGFLRELRRPRANELCSDRDGFARLGADAPAGAQELNAL